MIRALIIIASLLVALPAAAHERTIGERVLDGFGFAGSAALGATAGVLTGGLLARAARGRLLA